MVRHPVLTILGCVALSAILTLSIFGLPHSTPLPREEQKTGDSLVVTKPAFDSTQHATQRAVTTVLTRLVTDSAAVARLRAKADSEHRRADSLASVASFARTAADSATAWRQAYEASAREVAVLQAANKTLTEDVAAARDSLRESLVRLREGARREADHVNFEARLQRTIAQSSPPCRVALVLRCPTRKEAFVAGVVVASAGAYAVTHRSQLSKLAGVIP
jgi:hypothetical protein